MFLSDRNITNPCRRSLFLKGEKKVYIAKVTYGEKTLLECMKRIIENHCNKESRDNDGR